MMLGVDVVDDDEHSIAAVPAEPESPDAPLFATRTRARLDLAQHPRRGGLDDDQRLRDGFLALSVARAECSL